MPGSKILVVYYSRTGTTRKVAQSLAARLRSDSDEIIDIGSRNGIFGYLRSLLEGLLQIPSYIAARSKDPSSYDLVVIGTPVWGSSLSSPVRGYLLANNQSLPAVAFFCTLGGSGQDRAFRQMQELTGMRPMARLSFTTRDLSSAAYEPRVAGFAETLQRDLTELRQTITKNAHGVTDICSK